MTSVYESARKLLFITQWWWYKIKRVRVDLNPNASQAKHSAWNTKSKLFQIKISSRQLGSKNYLWFSIWRTSYCIPIVGVLCLQLDTFGQMDDLKMSLTRKMTLRLWYRQQGKEPFLLEPSFLSSYSLKQG